MSGYIISTKDHNSLVVLYEKRLTVCEPFDYYVDCVQQSHMYVTNCEDGSWNEQSKHEKPVGPSKLASRRRPRYFEHVDPPCPSFDSKLADSTRMASYIITKPSSCAMSRFENRHLRSCFSSMCFVSFLQFFHSGSIIENICDLSSWSCTSVTERRDYALLR